MSKSSKATANLSPEQKRALLEQLLRKKIRHSTRFPLSFAQERLWFLQQLDPESSFYTIPAALRLSGWLDTDALERSLNELIDRHESLRTTFPTFDGLPAQVISAPKRVALPLIDLSHLPEADRDARAKRLMFEEAKRPFDLAAGPLLRCLLVRLSEQEHAALFTLHHIISDGWSMRVLVRELAMLYEAFSKQEPSPLPDLPIQYADYAVWQREWLSGQFLQEQLSYWKHQLADMPAALNLPTDKPRPPVQSFQGATLSAALPEQVSEPLRSLSRQESASMFMVLLAAFDVLLMRYSNQSDIVVGTPIAGRTRAELEPLIGFFVNTLAMRVRVEGSIRFREVVRRVREAALGAYGHQEVPFEKLVEEMQPERSLSHTPLFQVMFTLSLQGDSDDSFQLPGLTLSSIEIDNTTAKFDLTLTMVELNDRLHASVEYNTDLFDEATIARLLKHYERLLEAVAANPDERISMLPLLTDRERHQMLVEWNDTHTDYPRRSSLAELFHQQVALSPNAPALSCHHLTLSYDQLNRRANQLAHYLRSLGAGPEVPVGICLDRGADLIVAMLAIIKAGAAYVPLDPSYPIERLSAIIEDVSMGLIVTDEAMMERLPAFFGQVVAVDSDSDAISAHSEQDPELDASGDNLAYIIYTSGSTGKPKGIAVPHKAISRLVKQSDYVRLGPDDVVAQASNSSFDACTFEVWGALLNGSRLVVISKQQMLSVDEIVAVIRQQRVNTMFITTALFNQVVSQNAGAFAGMKQVLFGGEKVDASRVKEVIESEGRPERLLHVYGPTESTTFASWKDVKQVTGSSVEIGKAIANTQMYVLDKGLNEVPVGVMGEIYIGGEGLARGYWNDAVKTAERFLPNPYSGEAGARMYATGDIGRYKQGGEIEFIGRNDNQVKIRGFRIEPEEVEAVLTQHPDLREAAIVVRELAPGEKRLVAYFVSAQEPPPTAYDLQSYLKDRLPEYMVPSSFVLMKELPQTPHGKIDRKALPAPDQTAIGSKEAFVAPRDVLELRLVQLWEEALAVGPVGIRDDFFRLGGHSLLAVRLMSQVEQVFEKRLPLSVLFQEATVEHMARCLRHQSQSSAWSPLVAIQAKGAKPPFFGVHPGGGNVLCYITLARSLGSEQPFYAFQSEGLNQDAPSQSSVEQMASRYIEAMRGVQPQGPYLIGGWSMGGVVAFEMARQLLANDERVALLALIDSRAPDGKHDLIDENDFGFMVNFWQHVGVSLYDLALSRERLERLQPDEQLALVLERVKEAELVPSDEKLSNVRRLFKVFKNNVRAMLDYKPQSINAPVILFRAGERPSQSLSDPTMGWGELTGGSLSVYEVPGDHFSMIQDPNVEAMAVLLRARIDEALKVERS